MNNSIENWLRLRIFLLRLALLFGLVFSLTCIYGPFTTHIVVRAGQPQERIEIKPKPKPAEHGADPAITEENKKKAAEEFRKWNKGTLKPKKPDPWILTKPSAKLIAPSKKYGKIGLNEPLVFDSFNHIQIPPRLQGLDLTAVHKTNERFLSDVPMLDENRSFLRWYGGLEGLFGKDPPKLLSRPYLKQLFANTSVITAEKLADGTEVLTVFDMPGSFDAGHLVGRMEYLSRGTDNSEKVRKIVGEQGQGTRVFFYGNDLHNIDLTSIANDTGVEFVRRTNKAQDLVSVQQRFNTIATRGFDPQNAVIVNGLPASQEAVENMGLFAGTAETWLDFRESIDLTTPPNIRTTSRKDDFFHELQQGDSDLLVLVAHSDGLYVYLNGSRISLEANAADHGAGPDVPFCRRGDGWESPGIERNAAP